MSAVLRVTHKFPSSGPTIGKVVILILSLGLSKCARPRLSHCKQQNSQYSDVTTMPSVLLTSPSFLNLLRSVPHPFRLTNLSTRAPCTCPVSRNIPLQTSTPSRSIIALSKPRGYVNLRAELDMGDYGNRAYIRSLPLLLLRVLMCD